MPTPLPDALKPLAAEIATYHRELPRLLSEGLEGRHALVKGDAVVGVFDDHEDAYAAGVGQFGFAPFLAQPIDGRDLARLAPYLAAPAGSVSA